MGKDCVNHVMVLKIIYLEYYTLYSIWFLQWILSKFCIGNLKSCLWKIKMFGFGVGATSDTVPKIIDIKKWGHIQTYIFLVRGGLETWSPKPLIRHIGRNYFRRGWFTKKKMFIFLKPFNKLLLLLFELYIIYIFFNLF